MNRDRRRLVVWLTIVFAIVILCQGSLTIDVLRLMFGSNAAQSFNLGEPWATVVGRLDAAKAAGLKVGDRLFSIDGRALRGDADYARAVHRKTPGEFLTIEAERDGQVATYRVPLSASPPPKLFGWFFRAVAWLLMPFLSIGLSLWAVAVRPRDRRAWMMLGILVGMNQMMGPGDPLVWPTPIAVLDLIYRETGPEVWSICMMLFGIYFPYRWRFDQCYPWVKLLLIAPLAVLGLWNAVRTTGMALARAATVRLIPHPPIPDWAATVLMMVAVSVFFAGLWIKYREASAPDDRRRLRLLYWGCSVSMAPGFLLTTYDLVVFHHGPSHGWPWTLTFLAFCLFPVTMAYVVVVHRALDVRVVIRQGVQYALARRGLRFIQAGLTVAVIAGSTILMQASGISLLGKLILIALGVFIVLRIRDFAERTRVWVDRRFFREAYHAEQILGELSEQVRGIFDTETLLETVVRKITESLHVERIAVMLREGAVFRPALATGYSRRLDLAISPEAPAVGRLRVARSPLSVEDQAGLEPLQAQLLLPLTAKQDLLGFISLGPKKSEEPYSSSDTNLLHTVAAQTGLALENSRLSEAIAHEMAQRELLDREIEIAREVQQRLFPQNLPQVATLEYAGHCRPARGVGGDYYDFLPFAGGGLSLAIGDVSGKGIPAALLMASLQASVRSQSQSAPEKIADLVANVNRLVCDASPENRYATFFYAQFDAAKRRLIYANGGHNPPMLLRGSLVMRLDTGGPPVGLFRLACYDQAEVQLEVGDLLLLFTDGISEAENKAQEEWGEEALIDAARDARSLPPHEIITRILEAADSFARGAPQHDDMTLIVARVL